MTLGSTQKGKVVESLIAATCILGSDGELSVSVPLVDDEGVDLILTPKGGGRSIFVQVKSRFMLTKRGHYRSQIRKKTFVPREDYYIIFSYYDSDRAQLGETLWLVPSVTFKENLSGQNQDRKNYIFQSRLSSKRDMWKPYRLKLRDLPSHFLELLRIPFDNSR